MGQRDEYARHHRLAFRFIARQAAEAISSDYRDGAITAIKGMHWSCSFGAAVACGAVISHAYAQQAAGDGIRVRAWLIS